jgi:hypothetical protein
MDARAFPEDHFSYRFVKIQRHSNSCIVGLENTMTALFAAALPFNVSVSWDPTLHIRNQNRTQGLLPAHRNNLLLLHPDYAFSPGYIGKPDDIRIIHDDEENTATSSIVTRQYPGLQAHKENDVRILAAALPQNKF